jgi:acetyltransferase-like isoleucine patch superfamily enzyme
MTNRTPAERLGERVGALRRSLGVLWRLEARFRGVEFGGRVTFNGRPLFRVSHQSRLIVGDGVTINSAMRANPLGCYRPTMLRTLLPGAELVLERGIGISGAAVCAARSIRIGEGTIIGVGAMIFDTDFHAPVAEWNWGDAGKDNPKPIVIGRGVFVAANAIILKGVTIGDRAVVGAGAVLTKDLPSRHIAVGNPAQIRPMAQPSPGESAPRV